MYDPTFEHPQADLLHELYAQHSQYWPPDIERAYGQALIGKELWTSVSQVYYMLRARDAFTFNAVLYHAFAIAQYPDHWFPVYIEAARQYHALQDQIDYSHETQGDYEGYKHRRELKDQQREIENSLRDLPWQLPEDAAPETEAGEPRQLDMFSEGV